MTGRSPFDRPAGPVARSGWLLAYAAATFLSFPQPLPESIAAVVGSPALDLGRYLGWLGPALLMFGLGGLVPRRAFGAGFLASLLAHAALYHWAYVATVHFGHAHPVLGVLAPFGMALYPAFFGGGFAWGFAWLARRGSASAPALALLWVAIDHLRSILLGGFPWGVVGYTQHANELLLPLTRLTGVYGLTFAVALGGAGLAGVARSVIRRGPIRRSDVLAVAGVVLLHVIGGLMPSVALQGPRIRVAAIQGNIGQALKWSPEWASKTLDIYEQLSRRAAEQGAEIIVWPETAVPGAIEIDEPSMQRLLDLAADTRAAFVVGSVGVAFGQRSGEIAAMYDSAFLIDAAGRLIGRYDKTHLVPFGEYLPFRSVLGSFVAALATGIARGDVSAGTRPFAMTLPAFEEGAPGLPGAAARPGMKVGVPICYELLFPDLVRRFVADGAGVLLAITNDAWYGRTGAPYQFLAMTAVRSAETGVFTVRAANTGVSAIIDADGRVRDETGLFEADFVIGDVQVASEGSSRTFYVRYGAVFMGACWLGFAGLIVSVWRSGRDRRASEAL